MLHTINTHAKHCDKGEGHERKALEGNHCGSSADRGSSSAPDASVSLVDVLNIPGEHMAASPTKLSSPFISFTREFSSSALMLCADWSQAPEAAWSQ